VVFCVGDGLQTNEAVARTFISLFYLVQHLARLYLDFWYLNEKLKVWKLTFDCAALLGRLKSASFSISICCAVFYNWRLLLNHDFKYIIEIWLRDLYRAITAVNISNLNMNKFFESIERVGHVLSIVLNIVDSDSPVVLTYVAEVVDGTWTSYYFIHIHFSKLNVVAVVGVVQGDYFFFDDTLAFQCFDNRLLVLRWCKTHHAHFGKRSIRSNLIY